MFENYTNNLPLQNSEGVTGDSNSDIDGEKVPHNIKVDDTIPLIFRTCTDEKG